MAQIQRFGAKYIKKLVLMFEEVLNELKDEDFEEFREYLLEAGDDSIAMKLKNNKNLRKSFFRRLFFLFCLIASITYVNDELLDNDKLLNSWLFD
jgi:hypothetical protein